MAEVEAAEDMEATETETLKAEAEVVEVVEEDEVVAAVVEDVEEADQANQLLNLLTGPRSLSLLASTTLALNTL